MDLSHLPDYLFFAGIATTIILVSRDARKQGHSWGSTFLWTFICVGMMPFGLALYFLMGQREDNEHRRRRAIPKHGSDPAPSDGDIPD